MAVTLPAIATGVKFSSRWAHRPTTLDGDDADASGPEAVRAVGGARDAALAALRAVGRQALGLAGRRRRSLAHSDRGVAGGVVRAALRDVVAQGRGSAARCARARHRAGSGEERPAT